MKPPTRTTASLLFIFLLVGCQKKPGTVGISKLSPGPGATTSISPNTSPSTCTELPRSATAEAMQQIPSMPESIWIEKKAIASGESGRAAWHEDFKAAQKRVSQTWKTEGWVEVSGEVEPAKPELDGHFRKDKVFIAVRVSAPFCDRTWTQLTIDKELVK
ncbi:MAG: hypothetical protein ABR507_00505 [Actinomycetota bacterium]